MTLAGGAIVVGPVRLPDVASTDRLAYRLVDHGLRSGTVFLQGEIGAGKSTFARALLGALGVRELVRSPTYTLVESYTVDDQMYLHVDLYRIGEPGELEFIGLRDLLASAALGLIEWPERGGDELPRPDLTARFEYLDAGRAVWLVCHGERIATVVESMDLPVETPLPSR